MKVEVTIVATIEREPDDMSTLRALPGAEVCQILIDEETDLAVSFKELP